VALLPEQAWTLPYMACATAISRAAPPSTLEGELPLAVADEEAPLAASDEEAPLTAAGASRWLSSVATTGGDCCIRGLASLQMRCAFVVGGSELLVLYCLACIAGVAQAAAFLLLLHCMARGGADTVNQVALLIDLVSLCCTLTMRQDLDECGRKLVALACTYWFLRVLSSFLLVRVCQWQLVGWTCASLAVLLLLRFAPRGVNTRPPTTMWLH
jgi:hypothetical protein